MKTDRMKTDHAKTYPVKIDPVAVSVMAAAADGLTANACISSASTLLLSGRAFHLCGTPFSCWQPQSVASRSVIEAGKMFCNMVVAEFEILPLIHPSPF